MLGFSAGSAYVSVVPSLDGFKKKIQTDVRAMFAGGLQIKVTPDFDAAGLNSAATAAAKAAKQTVAFTADLDTTAATAKARASARSMGQRVPFRVDLDRNSLSSTLNGIALVSRSVRTLAIPAAFVGATPSVLSLAASLTQVAGIAAALPAIFGSAGAGAATMIMGLSGVGEAFKQLSAQDDAAASTAVSAGKARSGAVDSVRSAVQALDDAQRSADRAAEQSAWQVADAREAVASAIAAGNQQVKSSEDSLAAAQDNARRSQEALTQARADAREELRQLQFSVEGAMYAEQDAADRLETARTNLANARQNKAGAEDIEDLTREVGKADLALREASHKYQTLQAEGRKWADTGIEGSKGVVAARRDEAAATDAVDAADAALTQARKSRDADAAAARKQLTRTIITAGEQQADASRAAQRAAEALEQAQASAGDVGAASAGKAMLAMDKLSPVAQSLVRDVRALGPAWKSVQLDVQDRLLAGIAGKITALSGSYLPVMQTQLGGLADGYNLAARNAADALLAPQTVNDTNAGLANMNTAVRISAGAMGPLVNMFRDLMVVGSSFLPEWAQGFTDVSVRLQNMVAQARASGQLRLWIQNAITVLHQLWQLVVNVGSIFGSVFGAMNRTGQSFLTTLVQITGRAATALKTPSTANGMQQFFGTIRDLVGGFIDKLVILWPVVSAGFYAFASVMQAAGPFTTALATLASIVLPPLLNLLGALAPILVPMAGVWWALTVAMKAYAAYQTILIATTELLTGAQRGLTLTLLANPFTWIALAIAALVGAIIYAWNHFQWFRDGVAAVWNAIKTAVSFAWNNILKPVFTAIAIGVQALARVFVWLWQNVLRPIFSVIGTVARVLASILIAVVIVPIIGIVRLLGAVFGWLWRAVLQPVFHAIASVAQWVWNTILRPVFNGFMAVLRGVGRVFNWLWQNILKPVWDAISGAIKWAWDNVLKPVFDAFKNVGGAIGRAFGKMKDVVVGVWNTLVDLVKKPIQVILNVIWNNSLRWLFEQASKVPLVGKLVPDFLTKRIDLAKGGALQPQAAAAGLTPMPGNKATTVDPQTWRVIGDRMRGREYYIPEDGSKNSLAVLGQAAAAFGQRLVPLAKGGILALAAGAALTTGAAPAAAAPAAGNPAAGAVAKVAVSGVTTAAKDATRLDGTVGALGTTLTTLGTATDAYKSTVSDLATNALAPLQKQLTAQTAPAFQTVATQTGVRNVGAVTKLRNLLPSLGAQQVRTGATSRAAWQQTTNKVVANQNTMQNRQNRLTTGMRTGWGTIATSTQQSVNKQRNAYGGLQQGMANTRSAMAHTATWAGTQYARMYEAAASPSRRTITGPLNGLVRVWNRLAGDFNMKPKVKLLAPGFAGGGDLTGPGTGTSDSFLIRASNGEFMVREKIASMVRPFLRALNAGQAEAVQAAGGFRARFTPGYAQGGDIFKPAQQDALSRVDRFGRKYRGKPYKWGGVGPDGWDCSGWIGTLTQVAQGVSNPFKRIFSTASFANGSGAGGFRPGLKSAFGIGVFQGSPGHVAATINGTNAESGGSHNTNAYGPPATGARDPEFNQHFHLPFIGGRFIGGGGGGSVDPASIVGPAFSAVGNQIKALTDAFPANRAAQTGAAEARKASNGITKFATIKLEDALMSSDVGGSGVERWAPMVSRALTIMGLPQSNKPRTLRRMGQESGGDARIVNRWDSNWTAGHPSVGLMQVIRGTYEAYKHPKFDVGPYSYGVSVNPLANTLASMRYAIADYGSLAAAYDKSGGYDKGGLAYGTGLLAKFIKEPERTLNPTNTKSFDTLVHMIRTGRLNLDGGGGDGPGGGPLIGEYHQHFTEGTSSSDALDEAMFELRRVRRSGRG